MQCHDVIWIKGCNGWFFILQCNSSIEMGKKIVYELTNVANFNIFASKLFILILGISKGKTWLSTASKFYSSRQKEKKNADVLHVFILLLSSNFLRKFFHREKLRTFKFFVPHTNLNLANLKKRRPNIEFYKYIVCVYCALHFSKRDEPNIRTRCRWKWMAPFY